MDSLCLLGYTLEGSFLVAKLALVATPKVVEQVQFVLEQVVDSTIEEQLVNFIEEATRIAMITQGLD